MKAVFKLSLLAAALAAAGCTSMHQSGTGDDANAKLRAIEAREAALKQREAELEARAGANALTPPNAKAGECYAKAYIDPVYKNQTKQVLRRAASERIDVTPAKYGPVEEKVLVKPASKRIEVIPATYEWVEEKVLIKPASKRVEVVAAEYEAVSEQILVSPAYTTWKKGVQPGATATRVDEATGDIMCLVEVPAVYSTVSKQVVKKPATTREVEVPAEYTMVKKQVLKTPPSTREIEIPAEYQNVTVTKVTEPAKEQRVAIPAEYESVTETIKVADSRWEWRSILCETNATPGKIAEIEGALKKAGYDPGSTDGKIDSGLITALNRYQRDKNLPVDRYINIDTVKALGVAPR